ncbi:uncharacterized protein LOC144369406 isoform X2 [Ictidomys tridecemlineatus]
MALHCDSEGGNPLALPGSVNHPTGPKPTAFPLWLHPQIGYQPPHPDIWLCSSNGVPLMQQALAKWPRLALDLESSCLRFLSYWDYSSAALILRLEPGSRGRTYLSVFLCVDGSHLSWLSPLPCWLIHGSRTPVVRGMDFDPMEYPH